MDAIAEKLKGLGYELPPAPAPNGNYRPWMIDDGLFVTSGQLSRRVGDRVITGELAVP
jgi:hypothetical protein